MPWNRFNLPADAQRVLESAPDVVLAKNVNDLAELAVCEAENGWQEVSYDIPGKGQVLEAQVCRTRNGIAANYPEPYMRRRDPDCMCIGDERPTNKVRFHDRFGIPFEGIRQETFEWLSRQKLAVFPFVAGENNDGIDAVVICPANAGFFAMGLAMLQGILDHETVQDDFTPQAVIYVAPPFRHTHFHGKQVVVHHRSESLHELFSYNLYPGPSAKKGIYGMLIARGEREGWVTAHCSTVQVITPYDNYVTIMHEGASGGGKSEMLEHIHREDDGRLLLGENVISGEQRHLVLPRACELRPVTDDMALCPASLRNEESGKLRLRDAEDAWFVRVNHIDDYGVDPHLERLTITPPEPLLFLNIDAVPNSRALIWEHIEDQPGKPCPNPRVVIPRQIVPGIINDPVDVDIRSFGVRTPPCTRERPTYGILGLFHVLPPALAWLWRLVAPRGHGNPSIVDQGGMTSEGVGSYWPFATGRRVEQANLLLRQIMETPDTLFVLCPNQHIGAWKVSFMPQWIAREYLARRGNTPFRADQLMPSRCPLLGHSMRHLQVEGTVLSGWFLQVDTQPEVGEEGYDKGAEMLYDFFEQQLRKFDEPDLDPLGRRIIEACLERSSIEEYAKLIQQTRQ